MAALDVFSPRTRAWFEGAFAGPTPAQELGWPAIASGEHALIQAPTGSGKTLAAFLYGIDRLTGTRGDGEELSTTARRREQMLIDTSAETGISSLSKRPKTEGGA